MHIKKATSLKSKAALKLKTNDSRNYLTCKRQERVITRLLDGETTVRELFAVAGNNPAETVRQLRTRDIKINMAWIKGTDQDGRKIRYGVYSLDDSSKASARALLGVCKS